MTLNGPNVRIVYQRFLPVQEVPVVLTHLSGVSHLMASLLYGAGLRLMECVRLRVKDVDFAYQQITVRDGKGAQDRVTMLPQALVAPLQRHLTRVQLLHEDDLTAGYGEVYLPYALARKDPSAGKSWEWQYVFPATKRSIVTTLRQGTSAPCDGNRLAKSGETGNPSGEDSETRELSYAAA